MELPRPGGNLRESLPNVPCSLAQRRSKALTSTIHRWQRCFGYVEQLCPADKEVAKLEQGAVERAFDAPHNSVPLGVMRFAKQFGMITIVSLAERSKVALAWTARSTCNSWRFWSEELRKARLEHGPMSKLMPKSEAMRD